MKNKQIIKLTESDLHQLVTESVKKCLNEKWQDDYNRAMDKRDYLQQKQEYDSKSIFNKLLAMIKGNKPKDPDEGFELKELLDRYVQAFNMEHNIGKLSNYGNGETYHSTMKYSKDKNYEPVLKSMYYDGNTGYQSRKAFDSNGNEEEWGTEYPYSEFSVTSDEAPQHASNFAKQDFKNFNKNRQEIANTIKNRKQNKK